jgi:hypothetical protein
MIGSGLVPIALKVDPVRPTDRPDGTTGREQPAGPESAGAGSPDQKGGVASVSAPAVAAEGQTRAADPDSATAGSEGARPDGDQNAAAEATSQAAADPPDPARRGVVAPVRTDSQFRTALAPVTSLLAPVVALSRRWTPPAAARGRPGEAAGLALARLTVLPAVLVLAWLIPGLPLLLLGGNFLPVPMLLISVPLAAALTVNGLRAVPATWPRLGARDREAAPGWVAWFGLLATVAVVAGLTAWQLRESSESVIVLRDAGTYLQAGYWIAQHGSLPITQSLPAFGGAHHGLTFASIGFLASGTSVTPGVTAGMPMLLAAGFWAHGLTGAGAVGPILGGLAELSFAGLVARLVGPHWAPAGALILGLSLPQQYVSRSTLSETALQVVLFGGLCLLADALILRPAAGRRTQPADAALSGPAADGGLAGVPAEELDGQDSRDDIAREGAGPTVGGSIGSGPAVTDTVVLGPVGLPPTRTRRVLDRLATMVTTADWAAWLSPPRALAALAGLALGFAVLISLDGLLYLLPVIPFGAILIVGRRPQAAPFLVGFIVGAGYGVLGALLLDRPLVDSVGLTAAVAGVAAVWLIALCVIGGQLTRLASVRRGVPRLLRKIPLRWLPEAGALLAAAVLIAFAIRPYVQTVHGHPATATADFIATLQRQQGLRTDPTRTYAEQSLYWVIWYIGLPTVLLGGFGIVLLTRHCLRALLTWRDPDGRLRMWALPLAILCAGSAAVLWRPDIVPDQPWASRRLVVAVLPVLIIAALWAASWLAVRARSRGASGATAVLVGLFCSAAMLVPTVSTTFGVGLSHGGKSGGLQPVAQGLAFQRIGAGQDEAVSQLCAQLPRRAAVVIVDRTAAAQFLQVVRGMCGVPAGSMAGQSVPAVDGVLRAIAATGRQPVLLASTSRGLSAYGGSPVRVLDLATTGDPHELIQLPTAPTRVRYLLWMSSPTGAGLGT